MAFKHSTNKLFTTKYGEPYLWGSGDVTTIPSNENKITASDGADNDRFGESVAVGSGRIVVGAYGDDDNGSSSGSAYIFDLAGTQLAKITASDAAANDNFGISVAIGNGKIVVGATGNDDNGTSSGSAYIFDLAGTQLAKITASDGAANDQFGRSVAVGSGRIVMGADGDDSSKGSAYIFDLDGTQLAKITASDGAANDYFGYSVAVGSGRIVVGADGDDDNGSNSGSAYIFDLDGTQLAKITASDAAAYVSFGRSVAIGNGRIVVGALENDSGKGSAYIFDLDGTQLAKITETNRVNFNYFGNNVDVSNGRIVVTAQNGGGAFGTGSAHIFDLDGNLLTKLIPSDSSFLLSFGNSVAVGNGRIIISAGSGNGSAYIYETPRVYTPYDLIYNEV